MTSPREILELVQGTSGLMPSGLIATRQTYLRVIQRSPESGLLSESCSFQGAVGGRREKKGRGLDRGGE